MLEFGCATRDAARTRPSGRTDQFGFVLEDAYAGATRTSCTLPERVEGPPSPAPPAAPASAAPPPAPEDTRRRAAAAQARARAAWWIVIWRS